MLAVEELFRRVKGSRQLPELLAAPAEAAGYQPDVDLALDVPAAVAGCPNDAPTLGGHLPKFNDDRASSTASTLAPNRQATCTADN